MSKIFLSFLFFIELNNTSIDYSCWLQQRNQSKQTFKLFQNIFPDQFCTSIPGRQLICPLNDSFFDVHLIVVEFLHKNRLNRRPIFLCLNLFCQPDFAKYKTYNTSIVFDASVLYVFIFCKIGLDKEIKTEQTHNRRFCSFFHNIFFHD